MGFKVGDQVITIKPDPNIGSPETSYLDEYKKWLKIGMIGTIIKIDKINEILTYAYITVTFPPESFGFLPSNDEEFSFLFRWDEIALYGEDLSKIEAWI